MLPYRYAIIWNYIYIIKYIFISIQPLRLLTYEHIVIRKCLKVMIRKRTIEANLLVPLIQKSSDIFSKKNFKSRIEY